MRFTEGWFPADKQYALVAELRRVADLPGGAVEIGAWEGQSTITIAQAIPDLIPIHVIDHWRGSPIDESDRLAAARDVRTTFLANCVEAGIVDRLILWTADWRTVPLPDLAPIRVAFIDAEHSFVEVADQIDALWPLLVPGGLLCGDDYGSLDVETAVHARIAEPVRVEGQVWAVTKPPPTPDDNGVTSRP